MVVVAVVVYIWDLLTKKHIDCFYYQQIVPPCSHYPKETFLQAELYIELLTVELWPHIVIG